MGLEYAGYVWMFNKTPILLLKLPYWEKNEARLKAYIRTFHRFTNSEYRLAIKWNKRNFSFSFFFFFENLYPACKIYSCKYLHCKDYVGESIGSNATRQSEHNNPIYKSEPAQHIRKHIEHLFNCSIWRIVYWYYETILI